MNIFISFSGERSNAVALALKKFISKVFDGSTSPEFFLSSEDIPSGAKWFEEISESIRKCDVAIIVLNTENDASKWMHFESGAIAFNGKNSSVCPFLMDDWKLEPDNPLLSYQVTRNTRFELSKLLKTINQRGKYGLSNSQFKAIFDKHYLSFSNQIGKILQRPPSGASRIPHYQHIFPESVESYVHGSVYVGAPMASLENDELYEKSRQSLLLMIEVLEKAHGFTSIFAPISRIARKSDFDGKEDSIEMGFSELKQCDYYVFIFLQRCISSTLIEVGYAIALRKKCIIFVKTRKELPFMLEQADKRNPNIKIYECSDYDDLVALVKKDGKYIFQFKKTK